MRRPPASACPRCPDQRRQLAAPSLPRWRLAREKSEPCPPPQRPPHRRLGGLPPQASPKVAVTRLPQLVLWPRHHLFPWLRRPVLPQGTWGGRSQSTTYAVRNWGRNRNGRISSRLAVGGALPQHRRHGSQTSTRCPHWSHAAWARHHVAPSAHGLDRRLCCPLRYRRRHRAPLFPHARAARGDPAAMRNPHRGCRRRRHRRRRRAAAA